MHANSDETTPVADGDRVRLTLPREASAILAHLIGYLLRELETGSRAGGEGAEDIANTPSHMAARVEIVLNVVREQGYILGNDADDSQS